MPENKIQEVADAADMIVAGYAFTKTEKGFVRVLNINNPDEAFVLDGDGNMYEHSLVVTMQPIPNGMVLRAMCQREPSPLSTLTGGISWKR